MDLGCQIVDPFPPFLCLQELNPSEALGGRAGQHVPRLSCGAARPCHIPGRSWRQIHRDLWPGRLGGKQLSDSQE